MSRLASVFLFASVLHIQAHDLFDGSAGQTLGCHLRVESGFNGHTAIQSPLDFYEWLSEKDRMEKYYNCARMAINKCGEAVGRTAKVTNTNKNGEQCSGLPFRKEGMVCYFPPKDDRRALKAPSLQQARAPTKAPRKRNLMQFPTVPPAKAAEFDDDVPIPDYWRRNLRELTSSNSYYKADKKAAKKAAKAAEKAAKKAAREAEKAAAKAASSDVFDGKCEIYSPYEASYLSDYADAVNSFMSKCLAFKLEASHPSSFYDVDSELIKFDCHGAIVPALY